MNIKEYQKEYYKTHREKLLAYQAENRRKHPEYHSNYYKRLKRQGMKSFYALTTPEIYAQLKEFYRFLKDPLFRVCPLETQADAFQSQSLNQTDRR